MALRAFYFIRALTKALTFYYINRSQRHLLATIENNRLEGPKKQYWVQEHDHWQKCFTARLLTSWSIYVKLSSCLFSYFHEGWKLFIIIFLVIQPCIFFARKFELDIISLNYDFGQFQKTDTSDFRLCFAIHSTICDFPKTRVKKILEKLSRTRFLTEFEFRALFFGAT